MRTIHLYFLAGLIGIVGCETKTSTYKPMKSGDTKPTHTHGPGDKHEDGDDDEHDRGKMRIEHAGPYHVAMTTHLSKDGNELEIFFETVGKEPKPVALAIEKITATVSVKGNDKPFDISFLPAPVAERKDDKPGTCSHFDAKTPFLKETDIITVSFKVMIRDKERVVTFEDFDVKKYSEKHEH